MPDEDFSFGCELIYEYVNAAAAAAQLYQEGTQGKKADHGNAKKHRKKYKEKKGHDEKPSRRHSKHQVVDVE